jgi:hypothetical protein
MRALPDRGVNVVKIYDQLPQRRAGVRDLAGDFRPFLDKPGESVRPLNRHAALLFQDGAGLVSSG